MTFNPDIPQAGDLMSNSQGDILDNFTALGAIFGTNTGAPGTKADHFPWQATNNAGLHQQVTLPVVLGADPVLTNAVTGMLYTKTISGITAPFFAGWNGSGTTVTQLGAITPPVINPSGSITFPGGLTMKWGVITGFTGNIQTILFSPDPIFTVVYNVQVTLGAVADRLSTGYLAVNPSTLSNVSCQVTSGFLVQPSNVYWFAIGSS